MSDTRNIGPIDDTYLDEMVSGYVECAIWAGLDWDHCATPDDHEPDPCSRECVENGNPAPLDERYDVDDIAPETLEEIRRECADFAWHNDADLLTGWNGSQAGHDFYLTRNRHGAGFWDRSYGDSPMTAAGERLTDTCGPYGTSELYAGQDGRLYNGG